MNSVTCFISDCLVTVCAQLLLYACRFDSSTSTVPCHFSRLSSVSWAQNKQLNTYFLCLPVRLWTSVTLLTGHQAELHVMGGRLACTSLPALSASLRSVGFVVVFRQCHIISYHRLPSVLWHCWLGSRKGIRPVKNWLVGCWHGYLSGARCRLAYGAADATATHCLLLQ